MTVLTDKRTYSFIINGTFKTEGKQSYAQIKFNYERNRITNRIQTENKTGFQSNLGNGLITSDTSGFGQPVKPTTKYDVNIDYNWKGDAELLPVTVFDNGLFTFFEFKGEVPAIFEVTKGGYEQVVNRHQYGNLIVVQKVSKQFTLRIGDSWVCIFNMHEYDRQKIKRQVQKWQSEDS